MAKQKQQTLKSQKTSTITKLDDEDLFLSVMQDGETFATYAENVKNNELNSTKKTLSRNKPVRPVVSSAKKPITKAILKSGRSGDVDGRTLERLKRGKLRPEDRLDLHGMTQEEAHQSLISFIDNARVSGMRSVIVITGRGRLSEGGGVLRKQMPQWLNSLEIRSGILAFTEAQPRDGGRGALYILIRRLR